jgi:predicted nucleic acid-binding protein
VSRVFVDSSVWIDHLRGLPTPQTRDLDDLLAARELSLPQRRITPVLIGDLVLLEVLRGIDDERGYARTRAILLSFPQVRVGGSELAFAACAHCRRLRQIGITIRKTVDCLIAAWCIENDVALLHNDRDFVPFEAHCGLRAFDAGASRGAAH